MKIRYNQINNILELYLLKLGQEELSIKNNKNKKKFLQVLVEADKKEAETVLKQIEAANQRHLKFKKSKLNNNIIHQSLIRGLIMKWNRNFSKLNKFKETLNLK